MPGGALTAISKASSAAISPSTSPGARSRPPRLRVSPGRQQPATGRAGDRLRLRQSGSHRTALPRSPAKPRGSAWCRRSPPRSIRPTWWPGSCNRCTGSATAAPAGTSSPRCRATRTSAWTRCPMRSSATRAPPSSPGWCTTCGTASREALLVDRESGRYADVSRVHPVDHDGEFLKVKGPLNPPTFGEARIPWCRPAPPRAGATSPPRWPTWCSRRPRTRRLP